MNLWHFFILMLCSISAYAQTDAHHKAQKDSLKSLLKTRHSPAALVVYKTNPFSIMWGPIPYTAEYKLIREMAFAPHSSFVFGISFLGKSPLLSAAENAQQNTTNTSAPDPELKVRGWRFQMGYRYYPGKRRAPRGFWCGPQLSWANAIISTKSWNAANNYLEVTHFNVNALAGYQIIIRDKVSFDFFFGLGYKKNTWWEHYAGRTYVIHDFDDITPLYSTHIKITLGINFGLAF
ncbi:MAG: hypothetical protein POELPBGB_02461 [Bacteroidia bacterium]|nr:hypothetical protein [Bacteroidia bacterium]